MPTGEVQLPAMPPAPSLLSPPAIPVMQTPGVLTSEERAMMEHLRGLQSLQMELPAEWQERLAMLEAKDKVATSSKPLTHGHLHKLQRLKTQVQHAAHRVQDVDREWAEFVAVATQRIQEHGFHYQRHRADLLESLNKKTAELATVKQELSDASQNLLGQTPVLNTVASSVSAPADLRAFHAEIAKATVVDQVAPVVLSDVEEDMNDAVSNSGEDPPVRESKVHIAPFRGAPSPNRVAKLQLKHPNHAKSNQDKAKEKATAASE